MRELDPKILARLDRECPTLARAIARRRGLKRGGASRMSRTDAARCAPRVMDAVAGGLRARSSSSTSACPPAAGHDAQNLATVTDVRHALHPVRGGRSHRPDEMSDWKAIERGGNVLLHTLLTLAG